MQPQSGSGADSGAAFTGYQKFVIAVLAFLQFTIILDFMILSPLGAFLIPALKITPAQFGLVVSAYAFAAGAAGFLASGIADRFDRKRLLLFFYSGFVVGTLLCGLAPNFEFLLFARTITGLFGGVIGSIVFAITTDLFPYEKRGRVMGVIQTAFAASQILGLPISLYLTTHLGWHAPFIMIVVVSSLVGVVIALRLKPIDAHLKLGGERRALRHLIQTVSEPRYLLGFATTALLATGGFMLMPFGSTFTVNNVGIHVDDLPMIYMITGLASIFAGPLLGRAADSFGKLKVFLGGSLLTIIMVAVYTHLDVSPLSVVVLINVFMFVGISARMIPSSALMSAIPAPESRGAFMSVSSSIQQVAGGIASVLAGMIVVEGAGGKLEHFDTLGYVVIGTTVFTMIMMFIVSRLIPEQARSPAPGTATAEAQAADHSVA